MTRILGTQNCCCENAQRGAGAGEIADGGGDGDDGDENDGYEHENLHEDEDEDECVVVDEHMDMWGVDESGGLKTVVGAAAAVADVEDVVDVGVHLEQSGLCCWATESGAVAGSLLQLQLRAQGNIPLQPSTAATWRLALWEHSAYAASEMWQTASSLMATNYVGRRSFFRWDQLIAVKWVLN